MTLAFVVRGFVRFWHFSDVAGLTDDVGSWG
jgi:hypothetical protein